MGGMAFFIAVVLGLTLYGVATEICRDRSGRCRSLSSGTDRGPVPGYSLIPGEGLNESWLGLDSAWRARSLETFHGRRTRLVLTAKLMSSGFRPDRSEVREKLEHAADIICRRTGADVVVIEVTGSPEEPSGRSGWLAMRCDDGLGWSGERMHGQRLFVQGPERPK